MVTTASLDMRWVPSYRNPACAAREAPAKIPDQLCGHRKRRFARSGAPKRPNWTARARTYSRGVVECAADFRDGAAEKNNDILERKIILLRGKPCERSGFYVSAGASWCWQAFLWARRRSARTSTFRRRRGSGRWASRSKTRE